MIDVLKNRIRIAAFSPSQLAQTDEDELLGIMRSAIRMDHAITKLKASRATMLQ